MDPNGARVACVTIATILVLLVLSAIALFQLDDGLAAAWRAALACIIFIYLVYMMFEMKLSNLQCHYGNLYYQQQPPLSSAGAFSPQGSSVGRWLSTEASSGGRSSPLPDAGYMTAEPGNMAQSSPSSLNDGGYSRTRYPSRTSVLRPHPSSEVNDLTILRESTTDLASDDPPVGRGQSVGRMEHLNPQADPEHADLTSFAERHTDLRTPYGRSEERKIIGLASDLMAKGYWVTDHLNAEENDGEEVEPLTRTSRRRRVGIVIDHPNTQGALTPSEETKIIDPTTDDRSMEKSYWGNTDHLNPQENGDEEVEPLRTRNSIYRPPRGGVVMDHGHGPNARGALTPYDRLAGSRRWMNHLNDQAARDEEPRREDHLNSQADGDDEGESWGRRSSLASRSPSSAGRRSRHAKPPVSWWRRHMPWTKPKR